MNNENNNQGFEPESLGSFNLGAAPVTNTNVEQDLNANINQVNSVSQNISNEVDSLGEIDTLDDFNPTPNMQMPVGNPNPVENNWTNINANSFNPNVNETINEVVTPTEPQTLNAVPVEPSQITNENPVNNNFNASSSIETFNEVNQVPTMPIPDKMPIPDEPIMTSQQGYQAETVTPVDYATPMSNFDEIGSNTEIDLKKGKNKKGGKLLLFILILVLIAALGAGSYYLINVKGIFNTGSVITNPLVVELNNELTDDLDVYATFKDTSSSNCVLDTSKVDTSKVGKYEYKITCGEKVYTGDITVQDTLSPEIYANITTTKVSNLPYLNSAITGCSKSSCEYTYNNEDEAKNTISTVGLKKLSVLAKDQNGNSSMDYIPVYVMDADIRTYILASKELSDLENAKVKQYDVLFLIYEAYKNDGIRIIKIKYNSEYDYTNAVSSYTGSGNMQIDSYNGIPVFNKTNNEILLLQQLPTEYIVSGVDQSVSATYNNYETNGFSVKNISEFNINSLND